MLFFAVISRRTEVQGTSLGELLAPPSKTGAVDENNKEATSEIMTEGAPLKSNADRGSKEGEAGRADDNVGEKNADDADAVVANDDADVANNNAVMITALNGRLGA